MGLGHGLGRRNRRKALWQSHVRAMMAGAKVCTRRRGDAEIQCRGDRQVARAADNLDGCDGSPCRGEAGDLPVAPTRFSNLRVSASPRAEMLPRLSNDMICEGLSDRTA